MKREIIERNQRQCRDGWKFIVKKSLKRFKYKDNDQKLKE